MAITFDPTNKRIILDSDLISATEIYSRWVDWSATGDNSKYGMIIRQVGSDDLGSGLSIPPYYFLQSGWRVRPREANHNLTITGNLFVEEGGSPVVSTLGIFQVNVSYVVPVQAQGISTGAVDPTDLAAAVRAILEPELSRIDAAISTRAPDTILEVNVKQVNDVPIKGTGVSGDYWGPV